MPNLSHNTTTYSERLDRVAAYIEAHLDDNVDLLTLSEVAHLSPYHFHRVYHAISGETVAVTVKRLRLQRAAGDLVQSKKSVAEVAKRSGLGSVSSFTRSFKSEYGFPPALYRQRGSHTRFPVAAQLSTALHREVSLISVPTMTGIYADHQGSYLMIARAFDRIFRFAQAHDFLARVTAVVGIYDDDPFSMPESQLRSRACLMIEDATVIKDDGLRVEIPGGLCAVLRHQGPYADMRLAYQWLYGQWLPHSGYDAADAPVFEIYLNHPRDTAPTDLLVDIYLPLN